jgi:hypothetical protein
MKGIFHYWNRLEYLEKFPLLQNAYEQSKQLYNQNKSSWYVFDLSIEAVF